ncbi:MAG TPA: ABC transporter permease, partial [Thermotogota bacterium]|nr:ABC transporter permease [Thermotogota bacterium]
MRTSICSSLFKYGLGLFLIALGWELASLWFRSSLVLPSLSEVFAAFFGLLNDPSLWMHLSSTFFKAFFGLFLALAIGLPLGVLIGL